MSVYVCETVCEAMRGVSERECACECVSLSVHSEVGRSRQPPSTRLLREPLSLKCELDPVTCF